jgi:hypothetical protein
MTRTYFVPGHLYWIAIFLLAASSSHLLLAQNEKPAISEQAPYGVVSPTELTLEALVGQTGPPQRVSLKNTGESQLTISNISISGPFAIPINHCGAGVQPGTHCDVYVTFSPTALETQTGTLTFTDNASNSPQMVSLTGTGVSTVATKTTLKASPSFIFAGQSITFTATVTSLGGGTIPDGELVNFSSFGGGGSVPLQSGVAVLTGVWHGSTDETQKVVAEYGGDQSFYPSEAAVDIKVEKWPVTVTASANPDPAILGQPVYVTVNVASGSPVAPSGRFCINGQTPCYGVGSGVGTGLFRPKSPTAATFPIEVGYSGDDYNHSGGGFTTEVINPTPTTTAIKSSKNPSVQGHAVKFIALITAPYTDIIHGAVTFTSGGNTLGAVDVKDSRAIITISSLPVGQDTVTASFSASDGNFQSSSASLVQTVQ